MKSLLLFYGGLSLLCLVCGRISWADAAPTGMSVVTVGNSHSGSIHLVAPLATLAGHAGYKEGFIAILGASLHWNWDHGASNKWPDLLAATNKWDAIILLSWDNGDDVYAPKFAGEVYKGNPQAQVLIYTIWPDANMSFDTPPAIRTEAHSEQVAAAVAATYPQAPKPRVIPSSQLIRELGLLADRGELPGVANRFALFSDGGHLSHVGLYAISVLVCAMLYNESPQGYPCDIYKQDAAGHPTRDVMSSDTVPADYATVVQRTVWDLLQTYPPAGMKPSLAIANRRLDVAIAGQPYKVALTALNTTAPCVWSLDNGALPKGLTLTADGIISGQSAQVGHYPLTVKVVTGQQTLARPLTLDICADTPPSIPEQPLSTVSLDTYLFQPLIAAGGVGALKWSLSDGKLPYGIMLSPVGLLYGTPGEAGTFTFTIKTEDSYPTGARASEKAFTWTIGPASPDSLLAKYVIKHDVRTEESKKIPEASNINIDGKLTEPFWNLDQPIAKKVLGTPTKTATFAAVWTATCYSYGPRPGWSAITDPQGKVSYLEGNDLVLAIKVLDGAKGKTAKDGVHIFLNGRHDHKLIYGADDVHIYISRKDYPNSGIGHAGWVNIVKGLKYLWFSKVAVNEIDGGYVVEVSLGSPFLTGDGQWLPFGARGVYGLDIAVDEGDDAGVSQQVWRGDANNAEDTSHFGTIILTLQPAVAPLPH